MTMKFRPIDQLFPHYCCACGQIGEILCASCYNDIVYDNEQSEVCIVCQTLTSSDGVCARCRTSFTKAWVVGGREGSLSKLINDSKYHSRRIGCIVQAGLMDDSIPELPAEVVVVPVPTIRPHIRSRGYGHSERIAKAFARRRGLPYRPLLQRIGTHVQQGSSLPERIRQAKASYQASDEARDQLILLIDDVYTTGSSVRYGAQALQDAGAKDVWIAVTARQTLDD